jgi:cyd operon protein YbgT
MKRHRLFNPCLGSKEIMWYFTWILGVLLAITFGVINVMWYESEQCPDEMKDRIDPE